jgi:Saccharopine dehydrogenase C-terminal domain
VAGGNLLDTLCAQLEKLMSFKPGERDLVMLQHKFVVEWSDQKTVRPCLRQLAIHGLKLAICGRLHKTLAALILLFCKAPDTA